MTKEAPDFPQGALARYQALMQINELIGAHRHFEDFFRELSRSLSRIISFEGIGVSIYDKARQTTELFLLETGEPTDYGQEQIVTLTRLRRALRTAGFETEAADITGFMGSSFLPESIRTSPAASERLVRFQNTMKHVPGLRAFGSVYTIVAVKKS